MLTRVVQAVALSAMLSLAGCGGGGNDADAGGCDIDACTAECLGDGGGVAACVADECLCFPFAGDAGDDRGDVAEHG